MSISSFDDDGFQTRLRPSFGLLTAIRAIFSSIGQSLAARQQARLRESYSYSQLKDIGFRTDANDDARRP